jgi:hypothetical protein
VFFNTRGTLLYALNIEGCGGGGGGGASGEASRPDINWVVLDANVLS